MMVVPTTRCFLCQTKATAIVVAHSRRVQRHGQSHQNARPRANAVSGAPMFGWQPPSGANPLEGALASAAPIEGLGALTGYWFLDVFAAMNVVLILSLVVVTSSMGATTTKPDDDDD